MLDKVKIPITREDGSPISGMSGTALVEYLTDERPVLVLRKSGGTVETFSGDLHGLKETLMDLLQN